MDESQLAEVISGAVRDVMETMCFATVGESDSPPAGGPAVAVRLSFAGERRGRCRVSLEAAAARTLAANFLGAEDEASLPEHAVNEAVCELANMVCGAVLSRLSGEETFDISHPEVEGPEAAPPGAGEVLRSFELDGGGLTVAIAVEEDA